MHIKTLHSRSRAYWMSHRGAVQESISGGSQLRDSGGNRIFEVVKVVGSWAPLHVFASSLPIITIFFHHCHSSAMFRCEHVGTTLVGTCEPMPGLAFRDREVHCLTLILLLCRYHPSSRIPILSSGHYLCPVPLPNQPLS